MMDSVPHSTCSESGVVTADEHQRISAPLHSYPKERKVIRAPRVAQYPPHLRDRRPKAEKMGAEGGAEAEAERPKSKVATPALDE